MGDTQARKPNDSRPGTGVKNGQPIKDLSPDQLLLLYRHPAQRRAFGQVADLIARLRLCSTVDDLDEFQRHLFQAACLVDERRAWCTKIAKRLRAGKAVPNDAPEPPAEGDPTCASSWEFEGLVHERLFRQYRSVGDGLAWMLFGFDRRAMTVLSRNASPGPIVKQAGRLDDPTSGLGHELGRIIDIRQARGNFALLNDLTNCLRIGDVTEFKADGCVDLHEVKSNPKRTDPVQKQRMQQAIDAINLGAPLPGGSPHAKIVSLNEPYRTNLAQLIDAIGLAHEHGCRGMKLSQGRALVATSPLDLAARYAHDQLRGLDTMAKARINAIQRAGISGSKHHIAGRSSDSAARAPLAVPWAVYPLHPIDCAALICDLVAFETIVSVDALVDCVRAQGLKVQVALPNSDGELLDELPVLHIGRGERWLTARSASFSPLLFELVEPECWVRGVAELLARPDLVPEPVLVFASDDAPWQPRGPTLRRH